MLDARKLSSKINYNVLAGLFDSGAAAVPAPNAPGGGGGAAAAYAHPMPTLAARVLG